ncbi:MAG: Dabb family protein [Proteobacteria bacterium]|nr:Dabb family protein [Pseudomonadota bacterium]
MIKHIVLWRLKDAAEGRSKIENANLIKSKLEALFGIIPGLLRIEVGLDVSHTESSSDLALYSEFDSLAALETYQNHPAHKAVMPLVLEARSERRVADYEV